MSEVTLKVYEVIESSDPDRVGWYYKVQKSVGFAWSMNKVEGPFETKSIAEYKGGWMKNEFETYES